MPPMKKRRPAARTPPTAANRRTQRLARSLTRLREAKGLTFDALAEATGVSRTYLWGMENGRFENPSRRICTLLATFYDIPVSTLLDDTDSANEHDSVVTWESIGEKAQALTQKQLRIVDAVVDGLRGVPSI